MWRKPWPRNLNWMRALDACPYPGTSVPSLKGDEPIMQLTERHRQYWQKNLRVTGVLLAIWFVVTFVVAYFARDLSFNFFGWPFSFWMGAQGALVIYVLIIWFYARYMNQLDHEHGVSEEE
jgi:putative solute:sodium symporter small subunit